MKHLLLIFICSCSFAGFSQKQGNIWYFGFGAGLDFNSGSPVAITDGQTGSPNPHVEGTSVISDSTGSLLFYTDGVTIWDNTHQIMPNGTGLLGHYSSTQSGLIVPSPADPDRYFYLFTAALGIDDQTYQKKACYSVIDICLNNGLGDVVATEKNIVLGDSLVEKLAATRHANGVDYWILTHKFNTDQFWAFRLSSLGVMDTVISSCGSIFAGTYAASFGQMKFSPDGTKIAMGAANALTILELYDFDPATGVVSNARDLYGPSNDDFLAYGIEFSPDNSKLYVRGRNASGIATMSLAQYDLTAGSGSINDINGSMYLLYSETFGNLAGGAMQLGPDGVIYMTSKNTSAYLSSIFNPNASGAACNFTDSTIYLQGKSSSFGITSFVSNFDYSNAISKCETSSLVEHEDRAELIVYPNPAEQHVHISFVGTETGKLDIEIVNLLGQVVNSLTAESNEVTIDLTPIDSGTYIVKAKQNGIIFHTEFLIKK